MKINYHNEDYKSNVFNIVIYILIIVFVIFWWALETKCTFEFGIIVLCSIIILPIIILIFFSIINCKKRKEQRNLNKFIIKNGICIKGKVVKIYDNYTDSVDIGYRGIHNVTAEIQYQYKKKKKNIVVDGLALNVNRLKSYVDKTVNIYIYNNMDYVDIINN